MLRLMQKSFRQGIMFGHVDTRRSTDYTLYGIIATSDERVVEPASRKPMQMS